jgi:ribonuclease E
MPAPAEPALGAPTMLDEAPRQAPEGVPSPLTDALAPMPMEDVWVELPAPDEKPARPRRRRSGGRASPDAPVEEEVAAADLATAEPEPLTPSSPEPQGEPAAEPAPEPATAANEDAPEPVTAIAAPEPAPNPEPVYDPAEIVEPPAAPRRGWWRR